MKRFFAREFIWFLVAFVLAFPLGLLFLWLFGLSADATVINDEEREMITNLYILGYILGFVGVYLVRFIAAAIQVLVMPPPAPEEA